jgi:hypothetical protein
VGETNDPEDDGKYQPRDVEGAEENKPSPSPFGIN